VILTEEHVPIGVITLMDINHQEKTASLGSWLGVDYWGKGYNEAAKREIFRIAFLELGLEKVFVGTRKENIRSQKTQEKLPYMTPMLKHNSLLSTGHLKKKKNSRAS
jgi:[ribosomal protein S5]-alanine N-acetyltransferase